MHVGYHNVPNESTIISWKMDTTQNDESMIHQEKMASFLKSNDHRDRSRTLQNQSNILQDMMLDENADDSIITFGSQ